MSTIVTRSGKGSPLTHTEVDNNFTNLNTDKLQSGDTAASLTITSADINGGTIDGTTIGASTASTGAFTTLGATGVATFSAGTVSSPSITTSGDTNTGIYFPAADTIAFSDGGAEAMRITSDGNVGIGTSSITRIGSSITTLEIKGKATFRSGGLKLSSSDDSIIFRLFGADATVRIGSQTATPFLFYTNDTERMRITDAGNVGIGTSSPAQKLEVNGAALINGSSGFARIAITGTPASGDAALQISVNSVNSRTIRMENTAASGRTYDFINGAGGVAGNFGFFDNTAGAYRYIIDSSGNLGLGVTPSAWGAYKPYQVGWGALASTSATQNTLLSSNVFFDGTTFKYIGTGTASYLQQFDGSFIWKNATSGTAGNAITFTQAMTLDASGNLGIGTTSPQTGLQVNKDWVTDYGSINISHSTDSLGGLGIRCNGVYKGGLIYRGGTSGAFLELNAAGVEPLLFKTNATERMRIDSSGNVGIGTSSPVTKLTMAGNIAFSGSQSLNWNMYSSGGDKFIANGYAGQMYYDPSAGSLRWLGSSASNASGAGASASMVDRFAITAAGNLQFNSGYGSAATAYGCRAWVNFNGTGTPAIRASGNVSSITDNGTGDFTINFATAMVDANYCYTSCCKENNDGASNRSDRAVTANREAGQTTRLRVSSFQTTTGTRSDEIDVCVAVFR